MIFFSYDNFYSFFNTLHFLFIISFFCIFISVWALISRKLNPLLTLILLEIIVLSTVLLFCIVDIYTGSLDGRVVALLLLGLGALESSAGLSFIVILSLTRESAEVQNKLSNVRLL